MTILSHEHAAVFRSGSKRLLWSEVERFFQLRTCSCFSSLDRRGCGFSATNMLSGRMASSTLLALEGLCHMCKFLVSGAWS